MSARASSYTVVAVLALLAGFQCVPALQRSRVHDLPPTAVASATAVGGEEGRPADASLAETDQRAGEVLGSALVEGVGEVRVEALDGGVAVRLAADGEGALSIEPLASLDGPSRTGLLLGNGCQVAERGEERIVAVWTGELARCATSALPIAVSRDLGAPAGCALERAEAGPWRLSVFACGRLAESLATVTFELPDRAPEGEAGPGAP